MKPSDFFVDSRRFFGALIPGILWVTAIVLITVETHILPLLDYASKANLIGVLSYVGISFAIGSLLQSFSFWLSETIVSLPIFKPAQMNYREKLLEQVGEIIKERTKPAKVHMEGKGVHDFPDLAGEDFTDDDAPKRHYGEWQVFNACKRTVTARSAELATELKEKEAEINLIGTLLPPLLLLILGLWFRLTEISELPVRWLYYPWLFGSICIFLLAIWRLPRRFHILREEEYRICLETFLLIDSGLTESRACNLPSKSGEPRAGGD